MRTGNDIKQEVNVQLAQLQRDYIAKLPIKIAPVNQDWQSLQLTGEDEITIKSMQRKLHAIAGTSSTLGVEQVAALTYCIEELLDRGSLTPECRQAIAQRMSELNQLIDSNTLEASPMVFK
ncbi:MAG: Hpt domain-containing protein [Spongiibacter sp.]